MTRTKLSLEDAIKDSPQTQAALAICEEDAQLLRKFTYEFHGYCEKIHTAQQDLAAASSGLATLMKKYGEIKFPLERKDSCMMTTFPMLAEYMEEISTMQQMVARQISDTMITPISRFISADLEELSQLQNLYRLISDEHELSAQRYAKLSVRCSEQERCDAIDEVFHMRKKLHRTALHYFSSMNLVQRKRQFVFLESMASHLQAYLALFKVGSDYVDRQELDTLHGTTKGLLLCGHRELDLERAGAAASVASLEAAYKDAAYQPERPPSGSLEQAQETEALEPSRPVSGGGYLMQRCRPGPSLQSRWERLHFAVRRGRLMRQGRRQATPTCLLDFRRLTASATPAEMDDRRHVFVVSAPGLSPPIILQAESAKDRDAWMAAINGAAVTADASDADGDYDEDDDDNEAEEDAEDGYDEDEAQPPLMLDVADRSSTLALLSEDGGAVSGAAFSRIFSVRLLGRCLVDAPDDVPDYVLRAAASAGSAASEQLLLAVSEQGVWLVEPTSRRVRCRLAAGAARVWPAGRRLLGLSGGAGRKQRRFECLALRLVVKEEVDDEEGGGGGCGAQTAEAVVAALSAAVRNAGVAHCRETALLLSNIGLLPDASSEPDAETEAGPTPPPRRPGHLAADPDDRAIEDEDEGQVGEESLA